MSLNTKHRAALPAACHAAGGGHRQAAGSRNTIPRGQRLFSTKATPPQMCKGCLQKAVPATHAPVRQPMLGQAAPTLQSEVRNTPENCRPFHVA